MKKAQKIGLFLLFSGSLLALPAEETRSSVSISYPSNNESIIEAYFRNFEILAKAENWKEIISQGVVALDAAKAANRLCDEAKICAQLTSTAFYLGEYTQALIYANHCHNLSEEFTDQSLFIRALYLESAIYRALASKKGEERDQQASYLRAVEIAEDAALIYSKKGIEDANLQGKIYFNLGAAHADNPKGDLDKAADCYFMALECFKSIGAKDDLIRTGIRLGKVYLLRKNYDLSQKVIDEVRPQIMNERLAMHADYLEAQLKLAVIDIENATKIAKNGLARAIALAAKEDELRLRTLLQTIEKRNP